MEGGRSLEINVISARDLKHGKVYVVVCLKKGPNMETHKEVQSPVDREGGVNPTWNFPVKLRVAVAQQNALYVVFKLKNEGVFGDKVIGMVNVPVRELLDETPSSELSYQVWTKSGRPRGKLYISYKFTDEIQATSSSTAEEPPPPPPVGPSSSLSASRDVPYTYPPPDPGYTYPPPSNTSYTYPPRLDPNYTYPTPDSGYTYPPRLDPDYTYPPPDSGYTYPPPSNTGYTYPPPDHGYTYPPPSGRGYPYPRPDPNYPYPRWR